MSKESAVLPKSERAESTIVAKASDLEAGANEHLEAEEAPVMLKGDGVTKYTSSVAEQSRAKTGSLASAKEDKIPSSEQHSKSEAAPESETHPPEEEAGEKTHDEEPEEKAEEKIRRAL
ncbi:hypothetical protein MRX96_012175 [Rhipicephalus microplus]